jgi:DNA-binding NtrC family response regulator
VPALGERAADILPLARHFLGADFHLSEDAAAALMAHEWPGNVRELRNAIERAKLLARAQTVTAADLNLPAASRAAVDVAASRRSSEDSPPRAQRERAERDAEEPGPAAIEASLLAAGGNISRAAQSLGLSRQALYRRLQRFNLRGPGEGSA